MACCIRYTSRYSDGARETTRRVADAGLRWSDTSSTRKRVNCFATLHVPTRWRVELVWANLDHEGRRGKWMSDQAFNTGEPIAYFITWTTYGTWQPGDDRGWWRKGDGIRHAANELVEKIATSDRKESVFLLGVGDRSIVDSTITRHCAIRDWTLHAVNVRSNHVHVVLSSQGYRPETVRDQLKAWSTRKLQPNNPNRKRFWTEGASCRWINHENDLEAAIIYTVEAQHHNDA